MSDNITEVSSQSWFGRMSGAFGGVLFGLAFLGGAAFLVFWNEGRTITTYRSLEEGAGVVVSVDSSQVDASNEGKLVRIAGDATTTEMLTDPDFGIGANALKLRRTVEVYQWRESQSSHSVNQLGGGTRTETTYSYEKKWLDEPQSSAKFKEAAIHANPVDFRYHRSELTAQAATAGAFGVPGALLAQLNDYARLPVDESARTRLSPELQTAAKIADSTIYLGNNPTAPEIGDTRIAFDAVKPARITIVAKQVGKSFEPYATNAGKQIFILMTGDRPASEVFKSKEDENKIIAWAIRAGGFVLFLIGFLLIMRPIVVLADVVPLFGSIVGIGTGFIGFTLASASFAVTFVVSWMSYRPLVAGAVAAGALGAIVLVSMMRKKTAVRMR